MNFMYNFLITEYSNQRCQNVLLYYISQSNKDSALAIIIKYIQSKISDTYEHSIHDHSMSEKNLLS